MKNSDLFTLAAAIIVAPHLNTAVGLLLGGLFLIVSMLYDWLEGRSN